MTFRYPWSRRVSTAAPARFSFSRALAAVVLTAAAFACAVPAHAAPRKLEDSTVVETWQLENGMRIVTRDVPSAPGVAITLAFGVGSDHDPKGREGWTALLAHAAFLSAAGEFPERRYDELAAARPMGWRVEVGRTYTRLTEVATVQQFPGVLHQVAVRLRGATPSPKVLAAAQKAVQAQLAENYRERIPFALHYQVRDLASPAGYDAALAYAAGKGVEGATVKDLQQAIRSLYVPANAVLSLAGKLGGSGIDLRRVIQNELGGIPAGTAAAALPAAPLAARMRVVERTEIDIPVGVIGVIAPALADTAHPSFYLHALLVGANFAKTWGRTDLVPSPFQYSLLDDPALVRIFSPITPSDLDSLRIREAYVGGLLELSRSSISFEEFAALHGSVTWMLGGPMNGDLRRRARTDPGVLAALSTTAAMRELWGGEKFWSDYRARFSAIGQPTLARWGPYFRSPDHQAQVLFVPSYLMKK